MVVQDALMTLPHWRYAPEYLAGVVYPRMAAHVGPDARVVEIGCREDGRGVLSRAIIPHASFTVVDRDPVRTWKCGGVTMDVLAAPITGADAILSTAVLHHTAEADIPRLLGNLRAPLLMFTGPNAADHAPYGDHVWHLDERQLRAWLDALGYTVTIEPIGLTEPFCELFVVARRRAS
jgi:hypothetical protein